MFLLGPMYLVYKQHLQNINIYVLLLKLTIDRSDSSECYFTVNPTNNINFKAVKSAVKSILV